LLDEDEDEDADALELLDELDTCAELVELDEMFVLGW
jgi:hypothetical protein